MPGAGRSLWRNKKGQAMRGKRRYRPKLATVEMVKKMMKSNEEIKYVDTSIDDATPVSGTGVVTFLTGMPTGDGAGNREGNEAKLWSIQLRGTISVNDTTVRTGVSCRCMIVRVNEDCGGALPSIGDILVEDSPRGLRNRDFMSRFQVIWDKTWTMRPVEIANSGSIMNFQKYKSWKKPRILRYEGASGAIADATKGHYFLVRIFEGTAAATWTIEARVNFSD